MKQSYSSLRQLFVLLLLVLIVMPTKAQLTGDPFEVNVEIVMVNKASKKNRYEHRAFRYGLVESVARAKQILDGAKNLSGTELTTYLNDNEVTSTVGQASEGRFKRKVLAGMAIVAFNQMEGEGVVIPIKAGTTHYKDSITYQALDAAKITGKQKNGITIPIAPPENDGDSITFVLKYPLEAKWAKEDTRVIIQAYMVDCQNEDTVAYCPSVVCESEFYHDLQDKRMSYDFSRNDPLGEGRGGFVVPERIRPNESITIVHSIKMKKPIVRQNYNYQFPYKVSVEDYHHVYFKDSVEGTCLQIDPFKLLDFSPALGELELTEDFRTPPESQFGEATKELNLRYEVGKYEYIDDSLNNAMLDSIVEELNSYGKYLIHYDIEGFASPDGSYETNRTLAQRRGANAAQAISRRITAKVSQPRTSVTVCTWGDVVAELKRRGKIETAEAVQSILDSRNGAAVFVAIKQLQDYDEVIVPVLESQRKMSCSIMFRRPHVLNAKEVVEQYYRNKQLPPVERFKFSEGDYFNLLSNMKDSLELEKVAFMAYDYCKSSKDFMTLKLTPYVANLVAMIQIKRGKPDKSILDPFLDYSDNRVDFNKGIDEINVIMMNRKQHILNQAVAYYMEEKLDTAKFWLSRILGKGLTGATALKNIIELRKNYKKENYLVGPALDEYKAAKEYVLNSNKENKAILYTEIQKWGKRAEAEDYVNMMDDDNPKKWYLKGILWADEDKIRSASKYSDESDDDILVGSQTTFFKKLSNEEIAQLSATQKLNYEENLAQWEAKQKSSDANTFADDTVSLKGIPNHLAYFQHSFDLNPALKKFYYNEGHVGPKLRRTYKYKLAKIPAYRKLFRKLKASDDLAREAVLSKKAEEE